ncbi:MAG TPA: hypothetical protein VN666_11045 [Nitrospira sp.]|nr:hypothetical protein [Nitrospira sp.]
MKSLYESDADLSADGNGELRPVGVATAGVRMAKPNLCSCVMHDTRSDLKWTSGWGSELVLGLA